MTRKKENKKRDTLSHGGLILEARSMFTEEVMSDEHEGATLFRQGGAVQLDCRLHSHCRRKKGDGKETPNSLTKTRNPNPKTRERNGKERRIREK